MQSIIQGDSGNSAALVSGKRQEMLEVLLHLHEILETRVERNPRFVLHARDFTARKFGKYY